MSLFFTCFLQAQKIKKVRSDSKKGLLPMSGPPPKIPKLRKILGQKIYGFSVKRQKAIKHHRIDLFNFKARRLFWRLSLPAKLLLFQNGDMELVERRTNTANNVLTK